MQMLAALTGIFPQDAETVSQLAAYRKDQPGPLSPGNVKKPKVQSPVVIMLGKTDMPGKIVRARNRRPVRIPHHPVKLGDRDETRRIERRFELPRLHTGLLLGPLQKQGMDIFCAPFRTGKRHGKKAPKKETLHAGER